MFYVIGKETLSAEGISAPGAMNVESIKGQGKALPPPTPSMDRSFASMSDSGQSYQFKSNGRQMANRPLR